MIAYVVNTSQCVCPVCASFINNSVHTKHITYRSMMAHISRLTFSKAPTVPLSTACKSAGWSSTRIACMQPWKERWDGGNNVWRKYPETREEKKYIYFFVTRNHRVYRIREWTENSRLHGSLCFKRVTRACGRMTMNKDGLLLEQKTICRSKHQT